MDEANSEWQKWFDQNAGALILFARQRTNCCADAEDIVQSAFIKFWNNRDSANNPTTYLFSCVASIAKDKYRSESRRRDRERSSWFVRVDNGTEVDSEEVEELMASLPENQREVVVLKIWGKLSFKQIAEVLSIPLNTAASRYRYAITALRDLVKK